MKLPPHVKDIFKRFAAAYPVPQISVGEEPSEFEERVRHWNIRRIEQVVFATSNNEGWGAKRADSGRPIGKDSIANRSLASSGLVCWDTLLGTGTGKPAPILDPDSIDIAGQVFVVVPGRDWIGDTPDEPDKPDDPDPVTRPYWGDEVARQIGRLFIADYDLVRNPHDDGMFVWLGRTMYDVLVVGEDLDSAVKRHRNECREILGLPKL